MPTKAKDAGTTTGIMFFDDVSLETTGPLAPLVFYDDFIGTNGLKTATNGAFWSALDTGGATQADVADEVNGVVALTLAVTSEAERAGLSFGDQRTFKAGQGLVFEARVCNSVTTTDVAEAVWGLASDTATAPDDVANNAWFKVDGSTAVVCEADNGTTDVDDTATGVVADTTDWRVYRIDASDAADVKFYIDGNRVCASTTFALAAATLLQPYFYVYKASGAGLGTLKIDYVRVWQKRS